MNGKLVTVAIWLMVNGPSGTTDLVQSDGPTATMPYLDGWFLNQSKRQY